ncbi:GNAT family N-acetyltransferase [Chitinivorax sp. PXF-14]|uniref:GNAT family N-acetyltransferase n=1 Tax=Chitinivorax sp. PXF-14 TaxID=3230488 RepID=UPI00346529AC
MMIPPKLKAAGLTIRMANDEDIPALLAYYAANQEFLRPYSPPWPDSMFDATAWLGRLRQQHEDFTQDRSCKLYLFKGTSVAGSIGLSGIQRGAFQACFLGYELAESEQGKGVMGKAIEQVIRYVFDQLKLHRIQANYLPSNERSGRLLKRLGFTVEGYARDYLFINGQWCDHILTSLTNPATKPPFG